MMSLASFREVGVRSLISLVAIFSARARSAAHVGRAIGGFCVFERHPPYLTGASIEGSRIRAFNRSCSAFDLTGSLGESFANGRAQEVDPRLRAQPCDAATGRPHGLHVSPCLFGLGRCEVLGLLGTPPLHAVSCG